MTPTVKTAAAERAAASARTATALERIRAAMTPLNFHFAGIAVLALVNLYLLIHLAVAWQTAHSQGADAVSQQQVQLQTAKIAALPLRGLDGKLVKSTTEADSFYQRRLPYADSQVIAELGSLAKEENVKLSRAQYLFAPIAEDPSLMQLQMDESLSGDYRPLVQFINRLERDKMFFLIYGVTLTGQQSGTVNLRLRLITYLRPPRGDEKIEPPQPSAPAIAPAAAPTAGKPAAPPPPTAPGRAR
jgi:type IV pilus assembly protein PilO